MKILQLRSFVQKFFVFLTLVAASFSALSGQPNPNAQRILIVYFSQPESVNLDGVDAVSGASVLLKNGERLGNNQYVAQIIQRQTGGDLFRIETVHGYPTQHDPLLKYAEKEQQDNVYPALKAKVENLADYDTIFIGYPIWWYKMPMPLYSFFDQHDLSGKTVIPFTVHGGSRFSDSLREIKRLEPGANLITQGLAISRDDVADNDTEANIANWLKRLNYLK